MLWSAVAVAMADGPAAALPMVDALEASLADYYLWHATRADFLRRLGLRDQALDAYGRAYPGVPRRHLAFFAATHDLPHAPCS
jgi:RNA polymerase sigma-70 factor (ECF subfamily)